MRLYEPLTFGPYAPTLLRKGAELFASWYVSAGEALRTRPYALLVMWSGAVFCAFAFFAFLFSLPPGKAVAGGTLAAPSVVAPTSDVRPLEVHIANNGLVLLRSARVLSINGNTITVATAWGETDFLWVIRTDARKYEAHKFGTRFLGRNGETISLGDIREGALVTITGMLDSSSRSPTLSADSVRSLQ